MSQLAINGGRPVLEGVQWPSWPVWDDQERSRLLGVLESGQWWYGEKVREFEERFAAFQDARYGVTTTSGTTAIEAALMALGIGAGDEVIVPPLTFLATASAVLRVNAIPVFADVDPKTLNLDPACAEAAITRRTKAIMPVHFAGYIADMDAFRDIALRHNVFLFEDACHSWGGKWKGKGTGALGVGGAFSFQQSKNIASAEGGIVLSDDEGFAETVRSYTNCGRGKDEPWYKHFVLGSNLRLTEFQAAVLLGQLTRLEEQTILREQNGAILNKRLASVSGLTVSPDDPRMTRRPYHLYPMVFDTDRLGVDRDRLLEALQAEGVPIHAGYPHALYKNPMFQYQGDGPEACPVSCPYYTSQTDGGRMDYTKVFCPQTEYVLDRLGWLHHTALLSDAATMERLADAVEKVLEGASQLNTV